MSRICRAKSAIYQEIQPEGGVLLHVETGAYHRVNELGALIWGLLEQEPSRSELIAQVRSAVTDPPDCLQQDVDQFLHALSERGLIVVETDQPA